MATLAKPDSRAIDGGTLTSELPRPFTDRPYQQCQRCILDTIDDPNISLDGQGVCGYCHHYDRQEKEQVVLGEEGEKKLAQIVARIVHTGRNRPYDCVIGLSGGIDSSYLAYEAKRLGLRALAVHLDNGWNSELAVQNIDNLCNKAGFELFTYVINWEEFRDLQLAYLKASVVDIEAITDHAIIATLYEQAARHGIRYILSGANVVTEAVLPSRWIYKKWDHINIKAIHRCYGTVPLKTFPLLGFKAKAYYLPILGIQTVTPLNYLRYNKAEAKAVLQTQLGWRDYGGKHYESVWTRFYQGYILPRKFGIDKRKAHLSTMICSGQMTRAQALVEVKQPIYDPGLLAIDKEFVFKKLGLSEAQFEALMKLPVRSHREFPTEGPLYDRYPVLRPLRPLFNAIRKDR
jgi:N-acetyl sugar amidotransferase